MNNDLGFNLWRRIGLPLPVDGLQKLSITEDSPPFELLVALIDREIIGLSSGNGFFLFLPEESIGEANEILVLLPFFLQDSTGDLDSSIPLQFKARKREVFTRKSTWESRRNVFVFFGSSTPSNDS